MNTSIINKIMTVEAGLMVKGLTARILAFQKARIML